MEPDLRTDFESFQALVQASLVDVTRSAGQVANQDLSFHRSASENLSRSLDRQNAHLLRLTNKLLKAATKDTAIKAPSLQEQDDIDDSWRRIIDVVDHLLEKTDSALDEFSGVIKRQSPAMQDTPQPSPRSVNSPRPLQQWSRQSLPKPQLSFEVKPDNYATGSFRPLLKTKPHAIVPLSDCVGDADTGYNHPYAREIEEYTYPASVKETRPPIPFASPSESKATYVDSEEGVVKMLEELKSADEIAIDLEHHDQHSYIGIVCLMQISTRDKDWIIDTLKPWRQSLQMLNEVFADPKILKVFQGASMDIIWLQRDLGLYVVGLFDTFYASTALQFPAKSLKYLLQRFANFEAQKQFQLADWRVRPLPQELLDYARADTHFLLNIYDHLRNMLVEGSTPEHNMLEYVLRESQKVALQVYVNPVYDVETGRGPAGWLALLNQRSTRFSNEQFAVFRAVHAWRDNRARDADEGIQNVLPNRFIWQIAENMPTSPYGFSQSCRGGSTKPVMDNVIELIEVVKQAKAQGKDGPSMYEFFAQSNGDAPGVSSTPRRPRHLTWRKEETTMSGVAATLQQMTADKKQEGVPAPLDYRGCPVEEPVAARSVTSVLWGNVSLQFPQPSPEVSSARVALASVLPIPTASLHEGHEGDNQVAEPVPQPLLDQNQTLVDASRGDNQETVVFTLGELSRSKKRKVSDALLDNTPAVRTRGLNGVATPTSITSTPRSPAFGSSSAPSPSFARPEDSFIEARRASKRLAREEKHALKASEAQAQALGQGTNQPFDYANAASLLNSSGSDLGDNESGAKRMNPFAKVLDTSTGARQNKMGKELAGKSMTFKS
ncbi:uncharacterized protein A1O9_00555 [Exophiala aquamarina CBS 119918]|uniref:HRDC domain-containing protein n=1 Tax=Exophiala aquamarina CBS 119918 TaxID=1182545 RepID=A0A072PS35_9EURO|nr:uncharacterized protein A1O9_00555 [Exophiala aquamarina CBS 119918]KEF62582.1 hypothetical protein A1O9_00555 [Exophiala aquamarina CBS 119918]